MADIEKKNTPLPDSPPGETRDLDDAKLKTDSDEDLDNLRERILAQQNEERQNQNLLQQEAPILPFTQFYGRKNKDFDIDAVATQPSVYDNDAIAAYFKPHERYENKHRFDPKFRWTWREELPLINRMDLKSKITVAWFDGHWVDLM